MSALAIAAIGFLTLAGLARSGNQAPPPAVICPAASPVAATPRPATPGAVEDGEACVYPGIGTPVAVAGIVVTLEADGDRAGPRDLTVVVVDAAGHPVTGATVTIQTRSLEMDHGVSTDPTVEIAPGRYLAERVSMGMGGDWLAEISISLPDATPLIVPVVVTLDGPEMSRA